MEKVTTSLLRKLTALHLLPLLLWLHLLPLRPPQQHPLLLHLPLPQAEPT